jgi:hypothetical protein
MKKEYITKKNSTYCKKMLANYILVIIKSHITSINLAFFRNTKYFKVQKSLISLK